MGMRSRSNTPSPMSSSPPSSSPRPFMDLNHGATPMPHMDRAFLSPVDGVPQQSIRLSSRLPHFVWVVLAKCLGIKLSETDRPILATILHVFTFIAALTFALPGAFYTFFDIQSEFSRTTVLLGSVQIIIGLAWACMGVYSHKLAGRLFLNQNFLECVRVHSKTFLKISTTWLVLVMVAAVIAVNCYMAWPTFYNDTCGTVQIEILVCQVFFVGRVVYAGLTMVWNFIVIYVLFSVCRTHTVGIRQLMRELNADAKWYEDYCLQQFHIQRGSEGGGYLGNLEESWYLWDDTGHLEREDDDKEHGVFLRSVNAGSCTSLHNFPPPRTRSAHSRRSTVTFEDGEEAGRGGGGEGGRGAGGEGGSGDDRGGSVRSEGVAATTTTSGKPRLSVQEEGRENEEDENQEVFLQSEEAENNVPSLLTNEDLVFTYWKFIRRLQVTSRYLQRWLASWIAFVVIWDGYFIIYWTSHGANLVDIVQFIVPLFILILLCSAYAEVNAEGQSLLKTICPTEERLPVVYYFNQYPLSITVFSIAVTYNTIVTAILAFSVAIASRMILDEIS
ncbi:hypothetical protein ACOMHN_031922 [Nucella lapillus]